MASASSIRAFHLSQQARAQPVMHLGCLVSQPLRLGPERRRPPLLALDCMKPDPLVDASLISSTQRLRLPLQVFLIQLREVRLQLLVLLCVLVGIPIATEGTTILDLARDPSGSYQDV